MIAVDSVSIDPTTTEVVGGESLNLTCTATIIGRGIPSFRWTGQVFRGPQPGQAVQGNLNIIFSDTLAIEKVSQTNRVIYCEVSISNSNLHTSAHIRATGKVLCNAKNEFVYNHFILM